MNPHAQKILDLAEQLVTAKARVRALEEEFAQAVDGELAPSSDGPPRAGIADRIRSFFRSKAGEQISLQQLAGTFREVEPTTIRTTTARIARERDGIERVPGKRGYYRFCAPNVVRLRAMEDEVDLLEYLKRGKAVGADDDGENF
jgi:hypothetical protein